jgi:ATP-dependent Clp protease adaptor protein ClpS
LEWQGRGLYDGGWAVRRGFALRMTSSRISTHLGNGMKSTARNKTKSQPARTATAAPAWGGASPRMADDDRKRRNEPGGPGTAVITKTKPQIKRPSMYRVLILNDDYTPMEFVVHVLERFFGKDHEAATRIMLHVHHHGIGECGIYTYEVAETKVTQVMDFARKHQHPLQCVMEKK